MICCLENISRKRQAGFFKTKWIFRGDDSHLGSLLSWVSRVLMTDQRSSSSLFLSTGSSVLSHEKQALSSCPLIELTPLRCSVYMPASLSQRTIEVRGVAIVYPQVSLTHATSTHFTDSPPYPPCNVNMSFPFWPWYLLMYLEQPYLCSEF